MLTPSCSACLGLELGNRELTGCVSTELQGLKRTEAENHGDDTDQTTQDESPEDYLS